MYMTEFKLEKDGDYWEAFASHSKEKKPIAKVRIIHLLEGNYKMVIRDYKTGHLLNEQNFPEKPMSPRLPSTVMISTIDFTKRYFKDNLIPKEKEELESLSKKELIIMLKESIAKEYLLSKAYDKLLAPIPTHIPTPAKKAPKRDLSTVLMTEDQHTTILKMAHIFDVPKLQIINALLYYGVNYYHVVDGIDLSKEKVISYEVDVKPETLSSLMAFAANGRFQDVATTHKYILQYGIDMFEATKDKESFLKQKKFYVG